MDSFFLSFSFFLFFFYPLWFCKTFIRATVPRLEQICPHLEVQCATFDPASGIEMQVLTLSPWRQ